MIDQAYSSVFTTMRWDGDSSVAHFASHFQRFKNHSLRLNIELPKDIEELSVSALSKAFNKSVKSTKQDEIGLVSLTLTSCGLVIAETRWVKSLNHQITQKASLPVQVTATALPAPNWNETINGCKHGDWQPYIDAKNMVDERGCETALFVKEDMIIDGVAYTPILLDDDGVAWYPDPKFGGINSISVATLIPRLLDCGIPVSKGRLTKSLISRAKSILVVGTGVGVLHITNLDGQKLGDGSTQFAILCHELFESAISESWFKIEEVVA
ncbi:MAG: hypothetical protein CMA77_01955 [Euryarchaeota archaeon]|nr:hypothetical protein [Euryarchaeota archaeon]